MNVISALAPVFLLVGVGYLLLRLRFADEAFFRAAAKLAYWIGLPTLLFKNIAESALSVADAWRIVAVMTVATLGIAGLGTLAARGLRLIPARRKTFIHTSFHCNTAFVGLPVILYALSSHPQGKELTELASMVVAPMIPIFNVLSVIVMRDTDGAGGTGLMAALARKILLNPQVLSCAAGLAVSLAGLRLPLVLSRSLGSLGGMALPLALLSVGAGLSMRNIRDGFGAALLAAALNVIALPLAGLALCRLWGVSAGETLLALVFLACPTAASAYVFARHMKGDPAFAGNVILLSTLLSAPALWLVLAWGL
jgi:hypothetical protein